MKPMLSATLTDPDKVNFPILASPKLDGIRCLIMGRVPVTRNLKKVPNKAIFDELRRLNLPPLDGELIVGDPKADDCYRTTNSGVMSRSGEPDWRFYVFDMVGEGPFTERYKAAATAVKAQKHRNIVMVPHVVIKSVEALLDYERNHLMAGYEGVMGRDPLGLYKAGRSTMREGGLWKLKRFEDSEAEILDFEEQMKNENTATVNALGHTERSSHKSGKKAKGVLGALKVRDVHSSVEFDIGTGFTDADRAAIWADRDEWLGRVVKYKFMPVGVKEKPRFPVYLGLRADL